MGRPEKYEPAFRQLRNLLADSRREGLSFDEAWERAVRPEAKLTTTSTPHEDRPDGCVVWPADTRDRQLIRGAVLEAEDAWRRGYDRTPSTPAESALTVLFSELRLDGEDEGEYDPVGPQHGHRGPAPVVKTGRSVTRSQTMPAVLPRAVPLRG